MPQMNAALFDRREDAQRAVHALRDHGVSEDSISVLAVADDGSGKISDMDHGGRVPAPGKDEGISTTTVADAAKGASEGAMVGAGLGLLAALSSIFIPGLGLITAGGALATALSGAALATAGGTITGGVIGFLADMGVPQEAAHEYTEAIKKGGVLVSVHDTDEASGDEIHMIFTKYNGRNAGKYAGAADQQGNLPTPQSLDDTNERASVSMGAVDTHPGETTTMVGSMGVTDAAGVTGTTGLTSAAGTAGAAGTTGALDMDAATGDEGAASSRLGDVHVASTPNDFGASTSDLEGTTSAFVDTGIGDQTPAASGLTEGSAFTDGHAPSSTLGDAGRDFTPTDDPLRSTDRQIDGSGVRAPLDETGTVIGSNAGNIGGAVGDIGGTAGGLTGGPGSISGSLGPTTGAMNPGGGHGVTGGAARFQDGSEDRMENTIEDMTGESGIQPSRDLAAKVAGTSGGASAGANDEGVGDLESNSRPLNEDDSDLNDPNTGFADRSGTTSGTTVGGMTNTGGSGGLTTTGGATATTRITDDTP